MKMNFVGMLALLLGSGLSASADTVFVTSTTSNCTSSATCGQTPNYDINPVSNDYVYNDNGLGAFTSAKSNADGKPPTPGARYFSNSFSNSTPDLGVKLNPLLGVGGGIYQVYHVFSSAAGNVSSNIVLSVTNVAGCTLSFTNTDKFQTKYGVATGGLQKWQFLGYLTNDAGSSSPVLTFYYESGTVNAAAQQRLLVDTFKFVKYEPCLDIPAVQVTGPLATNLTTVRVTGLSTNATRVTIYQDSGAGMITLGSTNFLAGQTNIAVSVTGLAKGAQVAATQTLGTQEGCLPTTGLTVGGGANPSIRVAFSIRANPNLTGPVGSTSGGTNSNIFFLGASALLPGTAPEQGAILTPGTNWQTVTFTHGDLAAPVDPFVLWNGTGEFQGDFGGLDGLAIASEGDSGPYRIYLDDLANGTNGIVQDWDSQDAGVSNYQFNNPGFSGTTSGNILGSPSSSIVTDEAAASGTRSLRVDFQFNAAETNKWLRLVTAAAGGAQNPQLDLNQPISIKILLLPPGVTLSSKTPGPIAVTAGNGSITLNWTGSFQLQSTTTLSAPFSDVPGVMNSPYTVTIGDGSMFFRLRK